MSGRMPRSVLVTLLGGALLLVVGLLLVLSRVGLPGLPVLSRPAEFGWFAYSGGPDDVAPAFVVMTGRDLLGVGCAALGLALVAAGLGFMAGRRRATGPAPRG